MVRRRKPKDRADGFHRTGNAAIEFALVAPLLLIMLAAVIEIGMAGYQAMQVQAAVEAGALYAAKHGATSLTAIAQAVTGATATPGITATPAPTAFCGCPVAGTGVVSQTTDCTTACPDKTAPGHYVLVNASIPHVAIVPFLSLPLPSTLTATSTVRVQ